MTDMEMKTQTGERAGDTSNSLSGMEIDTIGEILNISMGSAATAISTMLGREVNITTPTVSVQKVDEIKLNEYEPSTCVEIEYLEGLSGSSCLVMKRSDIKAMVGLLLDEMGDGEGDELNELYTSAVSEIMNQMMGASSTALASFFGNSINISTPRQFDSRDFRSVVDKNQEDGYTVVIRFLLEIQGVLKSEFMTVMSIPFTRELVGHAMNLGEEDLPEPAVERQDVSPVPEEEKAPALSWEPQTSAAVKPAAAEPAASVKKQPAQPRPEVKRNGTDSARKAPVNIYPLKLTEIEDDTADDSDSAGNTGNLGLILGVQLEMTVEMGKSKMPVKDILEIRQGSVIELDRQAGDPVDVIVNGQLIARGDVVVIDDNFGVRITEIVSNRETKINMPAAF